jgi:DNA-binding CsgD family transcriptional regulator
VIQHLSQGYSNSEIAKNLGLSESTVKSHLRNAFKKLKVRNRTEALALLYRQEKDRQRIDS